MNRWSPVACLLGVLLPAASGAEPPPTDEPPPHRPEITVQVLEDAWRVGDEKTYTLLFDRAPFGRQAMRLVALRERADGEHEAIFRQRITLDLRALGQRGTLEQTGTIVYLRERAGPYRYEEAILRHNGYATYRSPEDYRRSVQVELDPGTATYRVSALRDAEEHGPLPDAARAVLLDLLVLGHWERVFAVRRAWPLESISELPLLVPTEAPRFDFHLPVVAPREVRPMRLPASLQVEAMENIELFGVQVRAFRCRLEPLGMTLWVSPHGGILRFSDGRGLTGALEP